MEFYFFKIMLFWGFVSGVFLHICRCAREYFPIHRCCVKDSVHHLPLQFSLELLYEEVVQMKTVESQVLSWVTRTLFLLFQMSFAILLGCAGVVAEILRSGYTLNNHIGPNIRKPLLLDDPIFSFWKNALWRYKKLSVIPASNVSLRYFKSKDKTVNFSCKVKLKYFH